MELLKQPQYSPYDLEHQVILIYVGTRGYLDEVSVDSVGQWTTEFLRYMDTAHPSTVETIATTGDFTEETEESLKQAIDDFNANWNR
jgi:F-type H+-transporting ATPase subunit alpha